MIRRALLLALAVLLCAAPDAGAADSFSTDSSLPKRATVNGTPFFPRIFYDSGESSNFSDISVSNLNLGRFGMTHYLNYQFGAPYQKADAQLTPLSALGMWGFATGNAVGGATVDANSAGNGNFAVVTNVLSPTIPFRTQWPTLAGAGGVYLADEPNVSLLSNILQWRTTYHADMPTIPAFVVELPEGPLTPETSPGSGVESQFGSVGFTEHLLSVANPYWWMRNFPAGGNDWMGEDPYPLFKSETDPVNGVGAQGGYPHYWVADRAAHVVAAAQANGKVPILVLQLFAPFAGSRLITPNEMWQHTIMAVAEGIRGLAWWQIGTNTGLRDQVDPARTNDENALINITQFLKANETTILSPPITGRLTNSTSTGNALAWRKAALPNSAAGIQQTSFGDGGRGSYQAELNALNAGVTQWSPMLDQSGDVRHRVFQVGSTTSYLVFAYNYAPTARTGVTFTFNRTVASVTVVDEARTITPSGATWTDSFGGSSSLTQGTNRNAHIYQVVLADIASTHPGDVGICGDAAVFWCDQFTAGQTVSSIALAWTGDGNIGASGGAGAPSCGVGCTPTGQSGNTAGMSKMNDVPTNNVASTQSLRMTAVGGANSGGFLYHVFNTNRDEVFLRWYQKWENPGTGTFHHGMWQGGQNPVNTFLFGSCCDPPNGTDNVVAGLEIRPVGNPFYIDAYAKYPSMPSACVPAQPGCYFGIGFAKGVLTAAYDRWYGIEYRIKMNTPGQANGEIQAWVDGVEIFNMHTGANTPTGSFSLEDWIAGQAPNTAFPGIDWRATTNLALNFIHMQHYSEANPAGVTSAVRFSNVVMATQRIGTIAPVGGADTTPPSVPTRLLASSVGSGQINLTCTASTDNSGTVSSYRFYGCSGTGCDPTGQQIGTNTTCAFSDTGLAAGTVRRYKAAAVDPSNNVSTASATAQATAFTTRRATLRWTAVGGGTGLTLYGCTTTSGTCTPSTPITTLSEGSALYADTVSGTPIECYMLTHDLTGSPSSSSNIVCTTPPIAPAPPSGVHFGP